MLVIPPTIRQADFLSWIHSQGISSVTMLFAQCPRADWLAAYLAAQTESPELILGPLQRGLQLWHQAYCVRHELSPFGTLLAKLPVVSHRQLQALRSGKFSNPVTSKVADAMEDIYAISMYNPQARRTLFTAVVTPEQHVQQVLTSTLRVVQAIEYEHDISAAYAHRSVLDDIRVQPYRCRGV